jgi:PTH1 family peptidyl-tRNA hydrolase
MMALQAKKLRMVVAGLGNPGSRYENTPHNVGFAAVEEFAARRKDSLRRSLRFRARICKTAFDDTEVMLVQPLTYMNNSGSVVAAVLRYRGLLPDDLVIVSDDADLGLGRLRIRQAGSSGGHKGIESVIQNLGTGGFTRVRIGIGRGRDRAELIEHVLTPFSVEENKLVAEMIRLSADAMEHIIAAGVESAMNKFNGVNLSQAVS